MELGRRESGLIIGMDGSIVSEAVIIAKGRGQRADLVKVPVGGIIKFDKTGAAGRRRGNYREK